jgi:putative addiction module CopG family antidote
MNAVSLPPDLERFAAEAVASGRYPDVSAVIEAGVSLLKRTETARAALLASVLDAQDEGDRDGYLAADELLARVQARLAQRTPSQA